MTPTTLEAIRQHAAKEYPRECCGVVIVVRGKERYVPCRNIADSRVHFVIHPEDYAAAEDAGEVTTIVHSHCNLSAHPSQPDLIGCEKSGKPWLIISWPSGATVEFAPSGYKLPLLGREFHHGIADCYSLVRDYYREELNIELPDFERQWEWWERGDNLYMDNFEKVGFVKVDPSTLRKHDAIIMQVASPVPNHAAVFIGDNRIVHHVTNRLSSRDVYGGWFRNCTAAIVRHRSLM